MNMSVEVIRPSGVRLEDLRRVAEYHAAGLELEQSRAEAQRLMRLAINEAEALAVESGVPELVLPVLAEEKVSAFKNWQARQKRVWMDQWSLAV